MVLVSNQSDQRHDRDNTRVLERGRELPTRGIGFTRGNPLEVVGGELLSKSNESVTTNVAAENEDAWSSLHGFLWAAAWLPGKLRGRRTLGPLTTSAKERSKARSSA